MSIIKGTNQIVAGFGGTKRSIGEVYFSQSALATDNSGALPLFTGETIASANTIYPEFYNWVSAHTELQCTSTEYEASLTTYGECAKYVIGGGSLRLPLIKNYIKSANTAEGIKNIEAGLPNITGAFNPFVQDGTVGNGVFYSEKIFDWTTTGGTGQQDQTVTTFDASRSSAIYGKSSTVTPASTTLYPWVVAYTAAIPASTAQAAEFQQGLMGKADTNLGNLSAGSVFYVLKPISDSMIKSTNGLICKIGTRNYYKSNADSCFVALWTSTGNYSAPILVGETESSVTGYDDYNSTHRISGTFIWNSKTYYYTSFSEAMMPYDSPIFGSNLVHLSTMADGATAGKALLEIYYNTTKYTVPVETYENGPSWYRVYADGWCEQGCNLTSSTSGIVSLLKAFRNNNYFCIAQAENTTPTAMSNYSRTSTGFNVAGNISSNYRWYACGYIK